MSNAINTVVEEKALAELERLIKNLDIADRLLIKAAQDALTLSQNVSKITTPSGLAGNSANNSNASNSVKQEAEWTKKLANEINNLDNARKKYNKTRADGSKATIQERTDALLFIQNEKLKAKAISEEADAYQKLSYQLAIAQKNAQAIGATYGANSTQFKKASEGVRKLDDEIKKIDAGIGKHQRNVGNYAGGWNALGNSVNQITREAPAAAVSLNTFFLAISNNLPSFFDALSGINAQNKELQAQGQKTVSVWKQLGSAIFSFQSLLSIGVTLLTLYGGKIIDLIFNTDELKKALKRVTNQQELYNRQLEDANRNIEHNIKLEKNRRLLAGQTAKDLIDLDKKSVTEQLKNFEVKRDANKILLDQRIKQVLTEKDLLNTGYVYEIGISKKLQSEKSKLEKEYWTARNEQIKADQELYKEINVRDQDPGRIDIAKKNAEKASALVEEIRKKQADTNKLILADNALTEDEIFKARQEGYVKANNEAVLYGQKVSETLSDLKVTEKENEEDRLRDVAEMNQKEIELAIAKNSILLDDEEELYSTRILALSRDKKLRLALSDLLYAEQLRLAKNSYEKQQIALNEFYIRNIEITKSYVKQLSDLEKLDLDPITELLNTDFRKDLLKPVTDSAKAAGKELDEVGKKAARAEAALLKLQATTTSWLKSFQTDVFSSSGLGNLQTYFDDTFKNLLKGAKGSKERFAVYFNSIAESAQEAFNFISQASTQNFDAEKTRIEDQYNIALKYAGDNKEAQDKLAKDLEKSKKDIANREAKAKQKQAIFNIAIDTAQGVVSALASTPPNIVLSAIIGAIGLAQIAVVSSQQVPQYWMGGEHDGGKMMINDGSGSNWKETFVTPDGKAHQATGKNAIVDAPKGTKIYTHDQWLEHQREVSLNNMLSSNNIDRYIPVAQQKGMTKDDFYEVMGNTLGRQTIERSNLDANGFSKYTIKKGNAITRRSSRANGKA